MPETALRDVRILIVDDDESLRRALARAVRRAGHDVEAFASVQALLARGLPPGRTCLVLDVDLPATDAAPLRRAMWARSADLPVVLTTAFEADQVGAPLPGLESAPLLCKPFDHEALLDAIGRACHR